MPLMHHLPFLARLVLATWLLVLGAAIAAPAVNPPSLEMICSGGVMKLVPQDPDDSGASTGCPLCSPPGLAAIVWFEPAGVVPAAPGMSPAGFPAALAGLSARPPPARGPPVLLHA